MKKAKTIFSLALALFLAGLLVTWVASVGETVTQLQAEVQKLDNCLHNEELIRQDLEHRLRVVERRLLINITRGD